jgi:AraC-like DNA-binding protein
MDFSTRHLTEELTDPVRDTDLIKRAMAVALAFDASNTLSTFMPCDNGRKQAGPAGRKSLWPGGMHSHPYIEVCLPLTAGAAMELPTGRFDFSPPALALLPPGTIHCEAFASAKCGYMLMWMSCSGSAVLAHVGRYSPATGWSSVFRWALQHDAAGTIPRCLEEAPALSTARLDRLRADLLAVLAEMLRRSSPPSTPRACRPSTADRRQDILKQVRTFIDNHLDQFLSLAELAASIGLTPNYLNHLFKQWTGETIHSYIIRQRMEQALQLCREGRLLVKQIARRVGYDDPLYFSRAFHRFHGRWPTDSAR